MASNVAVVILLLIPVLILAQSNQDLDVPVISFRNARFGFQMLSGILKAVCKEKCPRNQRFLILNSAKVFCAVNCPLDPNNSGENPNVHNMNPMMPPNSTFMGGMMGNITMVVNMGMPEMLGNGKPESPEASPVHKDEKNATLSQNDKTPEMPLASPNSSAIQDPAVNSSAPQNSSDTSTGKMRR